MEEKYLSLDKLKFIDLDKVKFYYNGRGSLFESGNWIELLKEREKVKLGLYKKYVDYYQDLKKP